MHVRYRNERTTVIQPRAIPAHGDDEARAITRESDPEDYSMLTRAKFLRLSGATVAAAFVVTPETHARAKSSDGVVRVKSDYGFQETIERLKKDIATKGIKFFDE